MLINALNLNIIPILDISLIFMLGYFNFKEQITYETSQGKQLLEVYLRIVIISLYN